LLGHERCDDLYVANGIFLARFLDRFLAVLVEVLGQRAEEIAVELLACAFSHAARIAGLAGLEPELGWWRVGITRHVDCP